MVVNLTIAIEVCVSQHFLYLSLSERVTKVSHDVSQLSCWDLTEKLNLSTEDNHLLFTRSWINQRLGKPPLCLPLEIKYFDNSDFTSQYLFPSSSWRWEWGTPGSRSLRCHQRPLLWSFLRALRVFGSDPGSWTPSPALECCNKPWQWADMTWQWDIRSQVWCLTNN